MIGNAAAANGAGHANGKAPVIKVLMYHRIVNDERLSEAHWTCVHVRDFRRQLECLDRWGFTPITFEDYRLCREGELTLPRRPVIITFDDGYLDTYQFAYPALEEYGMKAVVYVLGDRSIATNRWDSGSGIPAAPLMEGRHIVELHAAGFEIGAHSMTHARLTAIPREQAWEEISRARMLLEILLNAPVRTFSYPYGLVNAMTRRMAADAGYTTACSVYSGPAGFCSEPHEVRRIAVRSSTSGAGFRMRMKTPYHYAEWLRWKAASALKRRGGDRTGPEAAIAGDASVVTPARV